MMSQQLPIPEVLGVAELAGRPPQISIHLRQLRQREPRRAARPLSFLQPGKASPLKSVHPTLHGRGILSQPLGDLVAVHALADEQQPMQAMVIARLVGTENLLLQRNQHDANIGNLQLSQCSTSCRILRAEDGDESSDLYCIT
jgi:hypothetical protein